MTKFKTTIDGNEMTFQSNHLGHFLLTNLLLDKLKESSASRIVNVSSIAHRDANLDLKDLLRKERRLIKTNPIKYFNDWSSLVNVTKN